MEASWQPDPTGRHQYRWWDGSSWSDVVADHGIETRDPYEPTSGVRIISIGTTPTREDEWDPTTQTPAPSVDSPMELLFAETESVYSSIPTVRTRHLGRWLAGGVVVAALVIGAIFLFRGGVLRVEEQTGIFNYQLKGATSFIVHDIKLERGQVVRFRVESPRNRDLVTYLMAPKAVADQFATQYVSDLGKNVNMTDPNDLINSYTDALQVFGDPSIREQVRGFVTIKSVDRCCNGAPDTAYIIATVSGTFRLVVTEAQGREAPVRIVVEGLGRDLPTRVEMSDAFNTDGFFTDSYFYKESDPYLPNG
jgi:hypothetical protein